MASAAVQAAAAASRRPSPQVVNGEARLKMLRADCAFFCQDVLGMEIGDHHEEWSDIARTEPKADILAARGHGKSGFWSHGYPIWQSWRRHRNGGLIVSNTAGQVSEFFRIIKEGKEFRDEGGHLWKLPAVADVPFLHDMLPKGWERTWTESKIFFRNGSRFVGRTFGKRFRGLHVFWIVVDDGIGDDTQYSEAARERDWNFLTRTLSPMLLPGGQQIVVGTPLHADDIHGRLAKNPEYIQRRYPAISRDPETGAERVLWVEFRPRKWLDAKRREIGDLAFGQEYLLTPATSEASLFPPRLFLKRRETLDQGIPFRPSRETLKASGLSIYFGVDVALSAEVGADYFVVIVLAVNDLGVRWVIDLFREKGMPFTSQLAKLEDLNGYYEPELIYIESNQAQQIYGDELLRTTDLPIGKFVTSASGKNSLDSGVPGLRTLIENGRLRFARGNTDAIAGTDILMFELHCFSWVNGKLQGVGAKDDTVMGLWIGDQAVRASRRMSFWSVNGDTEETEETTTVTADGADDAIPVAERPMAGPGAAAGLEDDPLDNGCDEEVVDEIGGEDEDDVQLPLRAPSRPATTTATAFDPLRELIHLGHVPPTCTLPLQSAIGLRALGAQTADSMLPLAIERGLDPCSLCSMDRGTCRGRPRQDVVVPWSLRRKQALAAVGVEEDDEDAPPAPAPAPQSPPVASVLASAGVDVSEAPTGLLAAFPRERQIWILAWNATMSGVGMPPSVAALVRQYGEDEVVKVLRQVLSTPA